MIRLLSFNGTLELGKTERGAILKAFDQNQAEMFSTLLPRIEFEAYPIDLKVSTNSSQAINIFKGQEASSITMQMAFPVPPAISYTRLVIVLPTPLNFTLLLNEKSDFSASPLLKLTQLQNYTGKLQAPQELGSSDSSDGQSSFSSASPVQLLAAEVSVSQGPLLTRDSASLKLEHFQVPLSSLGGNWLRVEMYESSRDMPGFVGIIKPLLSLLPRKIDLKASLAEFELRKSSFIQEVGLMRMQTTFKTDQSCPDVLQLTVRLEGVLDFIGNTSCALQSGSRLSVCKLERVYTQPSHVLVKTQLFKPDLQNLVSSDANPVPETSNSLPAMEFSIKLVLGLINTVKPESSLVSWSLTNEAGHSILNYTQRVSFGCRANCAACFIEGTDRCLGCKRGYRLNGPNCDEIGLIITLGQLIIASPHLSRDAIGLLAGFGLLVSTLIHGFLRKLYSRLILIRVIEKLLLGNLNTVILYLHFIGQDSPTWVESFLGPWLLAMCLLYALLFGMYLFLVKDYPFVSIKSGHWTELLWKWVLISVLGITNLYSLTVDAAVVRVLMKQERESSGLKAGSSAKGTAASSTNHLRAHTVTQSDGIELRQRERGEHAGLGNPEEIVSKAPSKEGSVKSGTSIATSKARFSMKSIAELQGKMLVLNLFDLVRWLNVSVKSLFILVVIGIEALYSPAVWKTLPFEVIVLIGIEIMHYVFFSVEHKEIHPEIKGSDKIIRLLTKPKMKQRTSAAQVAIAKPTEVLNSPNDFEAGLREEQIKVQQSLNEEKGLQFQIRHPEQIEVGFKEVWEENPVDHLEKLYESIWEKNGPEAAVRRARDRMRLDGSSLDIDSFEEIANEDYRNLMRRFSPNRAEKPNFESGSGLELLDFVISQAAEAVGIDGDFPARKQEALEESMEMSDASSNDNEPDQDDQPPQNTINPVILQPPGSPGLQPQLQQPNSILASLSQAPSPNKRKSRTSDNTPIKDPPKMSAFLQDAQPADLGSRHRTKLSGFEQQPAIPAEQAVGRGLAAALAERDKDPRHLSDLY